MVFFVVHSHGTWTSQTLNSGEIELYPDSHHKSLFSVNKSVEKGHINKYNLSSESNPGPEVIKLFSCSTQLSMKFFLLITVKMPTIVGILTFMSGKNSILCLSGPKKSRIS